MKSDLSIQFKVLAFLYLSVGFVPLFGSVDVIAPQWIYLSILNILSLFFLINSNLLISKSFVRLISLYTIFFFFSFFSLYKALNISESLIELSRISIFIISLLFFYLISTKIQNFKTWAISVIVLILSLEIFYFYINLFYFYNTYGAINLKGIAGNVNITAMSIMVKVCFLLYFHLFNKKYNLITFLFLFLSLTPVFLIGSRTSLIAIVFLFGSSLVYLFFNRSSKRSFYFLFAPLIAFFLSNLISNGLSGNSLSFNLSVNDTSALDRLSFYKEALNSFLKNPFLGVGTGNWKISSIFEHSQLIKSYFVPYHVHNDFLQVLAETGIFGFMFFSFFFFYILKKSTTRFITSSYQPFHFFLIISLLLYLLDSMFNFPMARPIMLSILSLIIVLSFTANNSTNYLKFKKILFLPIFLISIVSLFSSFLVFDSFKKQSFLLLDFKAQKFVTPIEIINSISSSYPSIIATTLPIDALKANYYKNNSDTTLILLGRASKANPYIKYPEFLRSVVFDQLNVQDSAFYYAKDAFNSIPLNEFHAVNYLRFLKQRKDSSEIQQVFNITKQLNSASIIYTYFDALAYVYDSNNGDEILSTLEGYKNLLGEERYNTFFQIFKYGKTTLEKANKLNARAELLFQNKNYLESANIFLELSNLISTDVSYLENAAQSFYFANYNNEALNILINLIDNNLSKSGKAHYLYGLLLFETSNPMDGCKFLQVSQQMGYKDASTALQNLCK